MSAESVGSCAGSPPKFAEPRRSPFRERKNSSLNAPDRTRYAKNVICYSCNQEGHYSPDCPFKAKRPPAGSSPLTKLFPKCPQKYPELPCKICRRPCVVRTSSSLANPGRDYYKCLSGTCKMFQWCDEVGKIQPHGSPGLDSSPPSNIFPKCSQKYPEFRCKLCSQPCVVRTSRSVANPGRDFYKCLSGACNKMFQWCDEVGKILPRRVNGPVKPVVQRAAAVSRNLDFPCTEGPCRFETKQTGRKYFACPLNMGQGGCVHSWCDGLGDDVEMKEDLDYITGMNNHVSIKIKEKGFNIPEDVVVPAVTPPLTPTTLGAEHEDNHLGSGSSPLKRPNLHGGAASKRKRIEECMHDCAASPSLDCYLNKEPNNLGSGSSPFKRPSLQEGAASKRKRIEECMNACAASPSLDCYLNKELVPPQLRRERNAENSSLIRSAMRRLNFTEDNSTVPKECVVCGEVGHLTKECPGLAWVGQSTA